MEDATPARPPAAAPAPTAPHTPAPASTAAGRPLVCVFGRLRVEEPGGAVRVPAGDGPRQLLVLLVLRGEAVHVEQAVDVLWPGESVEAGQVRLRNVLARLNADCGDIVRREGPTLVLDADTDLAEYEDLIRRLLSFRGAELALDALYLEWAQPVRRRLDVLRDQLMPAIFRT